MLLLRLQEKLQSYVLTLLQTRAAKGFGFLSIFFILFLIPIERIANRESELVSRWQASAFGTAASTEPDSLLQHPRSAEAGISAREQLRRRGSF